MASLFTNLSKNVLCTVNGPRKDRHHIENGPMKSWRICAVLVMMLCLEVGDVWGDTSPYSASANTSGTNKGLIDGWTGSGTGTYTGSGNESVKFDNSGDSYTKSDIWSGVVSSGMTSISVTIEYKVNGSGSFTKNVFTISAVNSSGTVKASQTFTPNSTSKTSVSKTISVSGSDAVTGLKLVYTTKDNGNVGVFSVSATATYTAVSCDAPSAPGNSSFLGTPLFEPLSLDNSWLKTHMEQLPYFLGPISYPAPPYIYYVYIP